MEYIQYKFLYYPVIVYALFVSILVKPYWNRLSNASIIVVVFPIIAVYILGMSRSKGIDLGVYKNNFYGIIENIYDPGYVAFTNILNGLGMPFHVLTIVFGVLSIVGVFKLSKYYSINFFLLFFIYFAHLFVVTDFSQLRIGAASSLAVIAFVSTSRFRFLIYILSASMHISVLFFIIVVEYTKFLIKIRSNLIRITGVLLLILLFFLVGKYLYLFSSLDERINIYINTGNKYGSAVTNYYQPLFHFLILTPFLLFRKYIKKDDKLYVLALIQILGISTFFAFSHYGVIAFRLTSSILYLYPVLIFYSFNLIADRFNYVKRRNSLFFTVLMVALVLLLILRPGSYRVVNTIWL
jgi:hypothetical protein